MEGIEIVREYYDQNPQLEWDRMDRHPVEFEINRRFIARHVKPGDSVLDIGGGPGRYSLWLSRMGCEVTLADLSGGNVAFAQAKAREMGLPLTALQRNALNLGGFADASFDHVLLMGPLYHLTEQKDRQQAVSEALRVLRPGGILATSFISSFAGVIYGMKELPDSILDPCERDFYDTAAKGQSFSGMGFTHAFMIHHQDVLPLMEAFPLETLHLLGSEGATSPCEYNLYAQPPEVLGAWIDYAERLAERRDLIPLSEHILYIGRKAP